MQKITPHINEDGTETVRLYGTTVDVTGKKEFTLFKKDYKVYRPRKKKDEPIIEINGEKLNSEPYEIKEYIPVDATIEEDKE